MRGFISIYVSYLVLRAGSKNEKTIPNKKIVKTLIIRSVLGNMNAFFMFTSILITEIYIVTIISNTVPIFTIILSYFFLDEVITLKKIMCILVGIFGIILIVDPSILAFDFDIKESSRGKIIGCILMVAFAICNATVKIILKTGKVISRDI